MSKRLTKTIWYGSDVDSNGNPILPSTHGGLDGLNYGELFLHLSNGKATLWTLSSDGKIVEITGGGSEVDMSSYLLKSIWDKVFEIRTDSQGTEYIFCKLPMVTQYGITMYSGDDVNVPSIASGLPFDGRTIWYNPDTNQIEVIGGTGGGSGEGVSNFWDLSGIPSWITNSKPKYTYSEIEGTPDLTRYALVSQIPSLSGYATESWVTKQNYATKATTLGGYGITDAYTKTNVDDLLKSYVTLGGTQTITGEKNFTGGLKVNDSLIYYDTDKKYWKLEGDLLVTGGVTMYGNEGTYTPSTIMDALLYDDTTLGINSEGELYVKGGTSGEGLDITALQNYLTQNSYLNVTSGDNRYLQLSGGALTGNLTIKTTALIPLEVSSSGMGYKSYISYRNGESSGEDMGCLGFNGKNIPSFRTNSSDGGKEYKLLHENNYSSYALPLSGGTLTSALTISTGNDKKLILNNTDSDTNFSRIDFQQNGVSVGQLGIQSVGTTFLSWTGDGGNHRLLHAGNIGSYNAGSATKLQTARTIWGQSFDGTGNVSGVISNTHTIEFDTSLGAANIGYLWTNTRGMHMDMSGLGTEQQGTNLTLTPSGNVGIGTASPSCKLDVNGSLKINEYIDVREPNTKNRVTAYVYSGIGRLYSYNDDTGYNDLYVGQNSTNAIVVKANSNVGIGTANPQQKLHVEGNIWANGDIAAKTKIQSFGNLIANGNVGIGTENPVSKCDINGLLSIRLESSSAKQSSLNLMNTSSDLWQLSARYGTSDNGNFNIYYYNGSTWAKPISINKNGNLLSTGGITMYSDQRKKTILNHVELSLKQIAEAPLIEHYYNSDEKKTTHVGSIAQYWASMNDWFCKLDSEGFYTMEIQNAALASAISIARELDRYETKTDKAIKKLKMRICELEEEVERLRAS